MMVDIMSLDFHMGGLFYAVCLIAFWTKLVPLIYSKVTSLLGRSNESKNDIDDKRG